jgi:hypothetical protein
MMSLDQLRKAFPAKSPISVLLHLMSIKGKPPVLTVTLTSGFQFRGYLINGGMDQGPAFVFQLEVQNEGDGAADICYVNGETIQAVTVWNVDDYPGALPK